MTVSISRALGFTDFWIVEFVGNTLASHFLAEVGTNICLFATGTVRANMTASISRSSFAQTCLFACLLDLFIVWHASFLVTPVMFRPCLHVLISCAIDCLACLLSGHLCHVQVLSGLFGMNVKIRVSIQVTVRSQDPKPKKHMERSTRAIPLIISYCNTVLVPAQKRSPPARSARLYFLEGNGKPRWLGGGPKHTALMTCLYMLVSSQII